MPKRRKTRSDPEFLRKLEELDRRARENDWELAQALAKTDELKKKLIRLAAER